MRKNFGIVMALVFVLSFGSLVFAQNTNSSTTGGTMSGNTSSGGSMSGRKRSRKHSRRRGRRHARRGGSAKKANGNGNM